MRTLVVVTLAGIAGCFSELPSPPAGDTEDTTAASTGQGSTGQGSTGPSTTTSSTGEPPEDQDPTSGSSGGLPAPEGLFACTPLACEPWDCTQGCSMADPVGVCVLKALRDRVDGGVEIATCKDGACAAHHVQIRGSGTDDAAHQWHDDANPPTYSNAWTCTLNPAEFFSTCVTSFSPDCADPDAWVSECVQSVPRC